MKAKQDRYWAHGNPIRPLPGDTAVVMEWFETIRVSNPRALRRLRRQARKDARRKARKCK